MERKQRENDAALTRIHQKCDKMENMYTRITKNTKKKQGSNIILMTPLDITKGMVIGHNHSGARPKTNQNPILDYTRQTKKEPKLQ